MYNFDPKRLGKLEALRELGIEPYPNGLPVTNSLAEVVAAGFDTDGNERDAEALASDSQVFTVAGRLRFKNEMGKAGFAQIQDQNVEKMQVYIRKNDVGEATFAEWKKLDLGDWIWVRGSLMRMRTGVLTLRASELRLYAKCIESMPDKHKGFTDPEQRQRMRYLDLIINETTRATFLTRSQIVREIRVFFDQRGFVEVETPMMQVIPGGAAARPFITHHNALYIDLYMRVAPELYLKRLVVGGFERVYEINRNFRNEGVSTKHNPEFTMLEWYQAHATFEHLMDMTEELVVGLVESVCGKDMVDKVEFGEEKLDFSKPWDRFRMDELVLDFYGKHGLEKGQEWDCEHLERAYLSALVDDLQKELPTTVGEWYERMFDVHLEKKLKNPTFVTHFPTEISPLSRRTDGEPRVTDRFELFVAGREIANGFSELNDPVDQAGRFSAQAEAKAAGDDEAMFFDADYIRALSYGMPPTAGEGIGIDRLVMLLTNQKSIREVILFPTLRSAQAGDPEEQSD